MNTRLDGTYVLKSDQIFLDGRPCGAFEQPQLGQTFVWRGEAVRLDGPTSALMLNNAIDTTGMRRRAARIARRRFDLTVTPELPSTNDEIMADAYEDDSAIVLTDGLTRIHLVPIDAKTGKETIFLCANGLPTVGVEYKVIDVPREAKLLHQHNDFGGDVICFTEGTNIRTEHGDAAVETLSVGDRVQTKDDGLQEILWIGHRQMSGARLHAMPDLRPVRLRRDALSGDIPDDDLLVSPHHRILITGARAMALFNQPDVLVAAKDLINDTSVFVDHAVRQVTYVHLLFASHQIIWANGVASESYHPASTTLKTVQDNQRGSLLKLFPDIKRDPHSYGPYVRRNLDKSEAAILKGA